MGRTAKPNAVRKNDGTHRKDRHGEPMEIKELPDTTPPKSTKGETELRKAYVELCEQIKMVHGKIAASDTALIEILAGYLVRIRSLRRRIAATPEFVVCPQTGEDIPNVRLETLEKTLATLGSRFSTDSKRFGIDPSSRAAFENANRPETDTALAEFTPK